MRTMSEARRELVERALELVEVMAFGGSLLPGILEGLASVDLSDLTLSQLSALLFLHRAPAGMGALANRLHVSISSATSIAKRLERRGLIRRSRGEQDRRVILCFLTDEGARRLDALLEHHRAEVRAQLDRMSITQLGTVAHALEMLVGVTPLEHDSFDAQ